MSPSITVQVRAETDPATVDITITGLDGVTIFTVRAQPPGEPPTPVRGAIATTPTSSAMIIPDLAPPLNRPTVYTLAYLTASEPTTPVEISAPAVTVPFTPDGDAHHVITDPYTGLTVVCMLLSDDDERTQSANYSALRPIGSANPVVIFDARQSDTGTLSLYTRTRAETLALVDLLAPGRPIISRHDNDACDVAAIEHLYPGDAVRNRRTRRGDRIWAIDFLAISPPDPQLVTGLVTLYDLSVHVPGTLADIAAAWDTLLHLAQARWGQ